MVVVGEVVVVDPGEVVDDDAESKSHTNGVVQLLPLLDVVSGHWDICSAYMASQLNPELATDSLA
jgi:hypothetical protein